MALARVCDVYGTCKAVKNYRVLIEEVPEGTKTLPVSTDEHFECVVELAPRALKRLVRMTENGVHPPKWRSDEQG